MRVWNVLKGLELECTVLSLKRKKDAGSRLLLLRNELDYDMSNTMHRWTGQLKIISIRIANCIYLKIHSQTQQL
jgi:hypothetical protein